MYIFSTLTQRIKEKWLHAGFQKYFRNTSWMFLGRIFTLVISFIVSVYMARNLGVENYGTLNFVISFVSIAGVSFFAIDSLLIRKLNHEPENTDKILGSAFIIKLINSFFVIITATIASIVFANNQTTTILVLVFSTYTIFQSFNSIESYFQVNTSIKNISISNIITSIISATAKIVIISLNFDIIFLLASYILDTFISALSYIYLYNKYAGNVLAWKIDMTIIKDFIIKSWPFSLSTLATAIYIRVDQIFLKVMLGSDAVGLYVVAVRFSEVWFFISSVICASLLPAILNSQKTNHEIFLLRSKRLYSLLFYSSMLICVFIFITSPLIIKILYGTEYLPSISLLRIYVWSITGVFIGTALQQILLAQNKFKTILSLNIIGMILSLTLNYFFISIGGIKGAAVANILAYTLPIIIILSLNRMRDQRISLISAVFKPLS